jgi:glycogen operon protein
MFSAGDEFMNTQQGNNNPYNQDNEITWLNWDLLEQNREVFCFFKKMIAFRKSHPSISRSRYWRDDIQWYGAGGRPDLSPDSRCLAYWLRGEAFDDSDLYVMINGSPEPTAFVVQLGVPAQWRRVIDTSLPFPEDFQEPHTQSPLSSSEYILNPWSIVVLLRR